MSTKKKTAWEKSYKKVLDEIESLENNLSKDGVDKVDVSDMTDLHFVLKQAHLFLKRALKKPQ